MVKSHHEWKRMIAQYVYYVAIQTKLIILILLVHKRHNCLGGRPMILVAHHSATYRVKYQAWWYMAWHELNAAGRCVCASFGV